MAEVMNEEQTVEQPAWAGMTTAERTEYLKPLIGKRIRYADWRTVHLGRTAFGDGYPIEWRVETLWSLRPGYKAKPAMAFSPLNLVTFDDVWDVQPAPEPTEPDYDGADTYDANEVACPCCGKKLVIVQRAELHIAQD